jgi:hypothetical protein
VRAVHRLDIRAPSRFPEARSPKPRTSQDHRSVPCLPPLLFAPPEAGTRSHGRSRGPLWSLAGPLAAHKRGTTLTPRHAHGRAAAGAMDGSHGEAPVPAGAGPNKPLPTFPCTCPSSPACRLPRSPITPPSQQAAAATVPGRRRRPSPTPSPAQSTPGIGPLGPRDPPPPVPGRRLAGIWPDRRFPAARDHIAKINFFPGSLLQKVNSNSKSDFLILVNCVENHRKFRKM